MDNRSFQRWILVAVGCLLPFTVMGNPVIIDPTSLLAFSIVAFWAFVVESGIVALLLTFYGLQSLRIFMAYFLVKAVVFLFLFQPLFEREWSIPILELLVVCLDTLAIKILAACGAFQTDNYGRLKWLPAFTISLAGNAVSFFIGLIAGHKPWEIE